MKDELGVVEATAKSAIESNFPSLSDVRVSACEVGAKTLTGWYNDSLSPILVNDSFTLQVESGFVLDSVNWNAFMTTIPASFLHKIYRRYKTKLFSANVRDYLGSRRSDQNINHGIKQTAETDPENFWAFNNGLTILVNDFNYATMKNTLTINGLSIVNGAQTTGAIGSLKKTPGSWRALQFALSKHQIGMSFMTSFDTTTARTRSLPLTSEAPIESKSG